MMLIDDNARKHRYFLHRRNVTMYETTTRHDTTRHSNRSFLRLDSLARVVGGNSGRCWSGSKEISVLGRVGGVDQQPSGEPKVGDEGGHQQQPGNNSIVTGPEEEQARVDSVSESGEAHGESHVAREHTPQDNGETEEEHEDTSENFRVITRRDCTVQNK